MQNMYLFGSDFTMHKSLVAYIRELKPVSKIISNYILTEVSDTHKKHIFYEELTKIYEEIPNYMIKMVLGDLNVKCSKEVQCIATIGKKSLHDHSNDNG